MYVRVEYNNKKYYSYVFGRFELNYMNYYIVYDSIENRFETIALFSKKVDGHRQIGIMNELKDEFIYKDELILDNDSLKKCFGYPWLINNQNLLKDIINGKTINEKYLSFAKSKNITLDPDIWNEISSEKTVNDLMNQVGDFHDWYLINANLISNPYDYDQVSKLQLKFSSEAAFNLLLEFEKPYIKYNFSGSNRINLSSIVIDKYIYWIKGDTNNLKELDKYDYFRGNKLKWKFVLKEENDW